MLKGNADRTDLVARFAADPRVTEWCVQPNYRVQLMRAGQPVLFWASGSRRHDIRYGVWGLGRLTGAPEFDGDAWHVPLDLVIAPPEKWIGRDVLRAEPGLRDLEVLRQPQAGNPAFVTVAEYPLILAAGAGKLSDFPR